MGSHHQEPSRILQKIAIEDVDRYNTQQFQLKKPTDSPLNF